MENLTERLKNLRVLCGIKKVLETEDKHCFLISDGAFFNDREIEDGYNSIQFSKRIDYLESLGFEFTLEEKENYGGKGFILRVYDKQ